MDSFESHSFLAFWKPRYLPRLPPSSDSVLIVPLTLHWNSFSYPSLSQAIPVTGSLTPQNVLGIQFALGALATGVGKSYLVCRNLFILLAVLSMAWGIAQVCFGNAFGIVNIVMMVFWMGMARVMANRMITALGEGEITMESKVEELSRAYLGADRAIKLGRSMQWVVVSASNYNPPPMMAAVAVPMGLPIN